MQEMSACFLRKSNYLRLPQGLGVTRGLCHSRTDTQNLPAERTFSKGIELLNGISQPTSGMSNWNGAISHGKELVQTTRLKA